MMQNVLMHSPIMCISSIKHYSIESYQMHMRCPESTEDNFSQIMNSFVVRGED